MVRVYNGPILWWTEFVVSTWQSAIIFTSPYVSYNLIGLLIQKKSYVDIFETLKHFNNYYMIYFSIAIIPVFYSLCTNIILPFVNSLNCKQKVVNFSNDQSKRVLLIARTKIPRNVLMVLKVVCLQNNLIFNFGVLAIC